MTPNRIQVAIEKYGNKIPADCVDKFRTSLKNASNNCMDTFMFIPTKNPITALLFSIFLGGFGVDRFYLGDVGLGLAKIFVPFLLSLITSALSFVAPPMGIVATLALRIGVLIWRIVDCFLVFKAAKEINYFRLSSYLHSHRDDYQGPYSYSAEKKAIQKPENLDTTAVEEYLASNGEYNPLVSPYKPVYSNANNNDAQSSKNEESESIVQAQPVVSDLNIVFTCPVCGQKMRITTVAAKYCCPNCTTIFPHNAIIK